MIIPEQYDVEIEFEDDVVKWVTDLGWAEWPALVRAMQRDLGRTPVLGANFKPEHVAVVDRAYSEMREEARNANAAFDADAMEGGANHARDAYARKIRLARESAHEKLRAIGDPVLTFFLDELNGAIGSLADLVCGHELPMQLDESAEFKLSYHYVDDGFCDVFVTFIAAAWKAGKLC